LAYQPPASSTFLSEQISRLCGGLSGSRPVRLAYQPPASRTFLSEQTSHQQPANNIFLSEQITTSHQPNEQSAFQKANTLREHEVLIYAIYRSSEHGNKTKQK
jgi:hypothetical protein